MGKSRIPLDSYVHPTVRVLGGSGDWWEVQIKVSRALRRVKGVSGIALSGQYERDVAQLAEGDLDALFELSQSYVELD